MLSELLARAERMKAGGKILVGALVFFAVVTLASALGVWITGHRAGDPIPAPLHRAIDNYATAAPKALAQVISARKDADVSSTRSSTANAAAERGYARAAADSARADSLARLIAIAQSSHDSSETWRRAYEARGDEAKDLRFSRDSARIALAFQRRRADSLDRARFVSDSLYHKADSLFKATLRVAEHGGCSMPGTFGLVGCPSRPVAFVAGAVTTAIVLKYGDAIRDAVRDAVRSAPPARADSRRGIELLILSVSTP